MSAKRRTLHCCPHRKHTHLQRHRRIQCHIHVEIGKSFCHLNRKTIPSMTPYVCVYIYTFIYDIWKLDEIRNHSCVYVFTQATCTYLYNIVIIIIYTQLHTHFFKYSVYIYTYIWYVETCVGICKYGYVLHDLVSRHARWPWALGTPCKQDKLFMWVCGF